MSKVKSKRDKRKHRHVRVRARVRGTAAIPRLSVFRSSRNIWAQLIDDSRGETVASAGGKGTKVGKKPAGSALERAEKIGEAIAKLAVDKKISSAVFDRGGYKYHGLIRAVADGARKGGLKL